MESKHVCLFPHHYTHNHLQPLCIHFKLIVFSCVVLTWPLGPGSPDCPCWMNRNNFNSGYLEAVKSIQSLQTAVFIYLLSLFSSQTLYTRITLSKTQVKSISVIRSSYFLWCALWYTVSISLHKYVCVISRRVYSRCRPSPPLCLGIPIRKFSCTSDGFSVSLNGWGTRNLL